MEQYPARLHATPRLGARVSLASPTHGRRALTLAVAWRCLRHIITTLGTIDTLAIEPVTPHLATPDHVSGPTPHKVRHTTYSFKVLYSWCCLLCPYRLDELLLPSPERPSAPRLVPPSPGPAGTPARQPPPRHPARRIPHVNHFPCATPVRGSAWWQGSPGYPFLVTPTEVTGRPDLIEEFRG